VATTIQGEFWNGRSVLLTGHTGFKGSWLALWLTELGARVSGVGLEPDTDPHLFLQLGL
jgi:CDP-glucose 4,6-dehydratase